MKSKQVEFTWNGKSDDVTNIDLPFQIIEQVDEPRTEKVKLAQKNLLILIWSSNCRLDE